MAADHQLNTRLLPCSGLQKGCHYKKVEFYTNIKSSMQKKKIKINIAVFFYTLARKKVVTVSFAAALL